MKLFNFKKKKSNFKITDADRIWVEQNMAWLMDVYGYPNKENLQFTMTDHFFPTTFSEDNFQLKNIIDDFAQLLDLPNNKIITEIHKDIRDSENVEYMYEGKPFETSLEVLENNYKIHIANNLIQHPYRLSYNLIHEFIRIRLIESKLEFDTGNDSNLFIYLAGIYFGFGILLTNNLVDRGRTSDGFMDTKWNFVSEMPAEVMSFGLALYSKLIDDDNPEWKSELKPNLQKYFEDAIDLLDKKPTNLFNDLELKANTLFNKSLSEQEKKNTQAEISLLKQAIPLTKDEVLLSDLYNNLGYAQIRLQEFENSIENFKKALSIDPDFGYAHDNLGYAFIQLGKLEEGRKVLDLAFKTDNNDDAYSYRNMALYHIGKNEMEEAEKNFQLAFENETFPVDFLEFHYANFLLNQGKKEEGITYLKIASEKGEQMAITQLNSLLNQ